LNIYNKQNKTNNTKKEPEKQDEDHTQDEVVVQPPSVCVCVCVGIVRMNAHTHLREDVREFLCEEELEHNRIIEIRVEGCYNVPLLWRRMEYAAEVFRVNGVCVWWCVCVCDVCVCVCVWLCACARVCVSFRFEFYLL